MAPRLDDIVRFRSDRLFNGAVNIDWFQDDQDRCRAAAEAFVFHGPTYHGVAQDDVGRAHGHQLQDTATFAQSIVQRCFGEEEQPFTLAIAGYGTGKSHLALSLAVLLADPSGDVADTVLSNIDTADPGIGNNIRVVLKESAQPCLVVALNGMRSFDLSAELTRQVLYQLRASGLDTNRLDELRPRFSQAANLISMSSEKVIDELIDTCNKQDAVAIREALEEQDERVYSAVQEFFAARGMPIRALGGESVRDVIDLVCRDYCGEGKPFRRFVLLFDEFGRYTEFATMRSQIAGSGALQDLFEGMQANSDCAVLVGFIQFELNAYIQRVAPEFKNDILRYVTRYQSAKRAYLSINLETLLASLLEKKDRTRINSWFDDDTAFHESEAIATRLRAWFPQCGNHRLWCDAEKFHAVIRKGCWPLSPSSTWFLFYISAAGKHLQERSALTLLEEVFGRQMDQQIPEEAGWALRPADLWTAQLQEELISSEEGGQQGSVVHAYASVMSRHSNQLTEEQARILRATVLASKLGLKVDSRDEAIVALAEFAGLPNSAAQESVAELQEEHNVLEWDESFKQFDILGDAVPRTQFLSFIRQRVASSFDENGKAELFASKAATWCDLLSDLDCDFAEKNDITTREWRYEGVTTNLEFLPAQMSFATERWGKAVAVDKPRGSIVYCYVEPTRDPAVVETDVAKLLRGAAKRAKTKGIPILVVLIVDEDGRLGQALAEIEVLENSITEQERARFGNLTGAHTEKTLQVLRTLVQDRIKERRYVTCLKDRLESRRLGRVGTELLERLYSKPLAFPFDGFTTARGNAANTCQTLTSELLGGRLDYDGLIARPPKVKNRGVRVLRDSWGVFNKDGSVSRHPTEPVVKSITRKWDRTLKDDSEPFLLGQVLEEICLPPNGANLASAGLLLGVFIAPRGDDIAVVANGEQFAVSQWLQDGVFRGKFLDLPSLSETELVPLAGSSSEWEELLDEWEQAESYLDRTAGLERAQNLKEHIPIPPSLSYRFIHLQEQSQQALRAVRKMEDRQNKAFTKLESGYERKNVNLLSWGAANLEEITQAMESEQPLWTSHQISELEPRLERARQTIIQLFPEWVKRQMPRADSPDEVGKFKHVMLNLAGRNLKKLGLGDQYEQLEAHTMKLVRQAETAAEARKLLRDVKSWLDQHSDSLRMPRVAELRGLRDVGKDFGYKLQGMARRIELKDLGVARRRLSDFLAHIKETEKDVMKRASRIWKSALRSEEDLQCRLDEVQDLLPIFEGCDADVKDFHIMRRLLQALQNYYRQLANERLSSTELAGLVERSREEVLSLFDDEAIPWDIEESFRGFLTEIGKKRTKWSIAWIAELRGETADAGNLSVEEANRLHAKCQDPPPFLTEQDRKEVDEIVSALEERLNDLDLDWLIERFKELPEPSKQKFLEFAEALAQGNQ